MSGKCPSILQYKEGFEWNGRAVKELAVAGSTYVHLKRPSNVLDNSTDLVELPQYFITTPSMSHDDDNNGNVCYLKLLCYCFYLIYISYYNR